MTISQPSLSQRSKPVSTSAIHKSRSNSTYIKNGTSSYRRAGIAMFLAGFSSFSLLYCVQPLLPQFASEFGISPAKSSLAVSVSTGVLAFAIVLAGAFSQSLGRKGLMFASMLMTSILCLLSAYVEHWSVFLSIRALMGFLLGGVPAIAMAWLSEEIAPEHLGKSMGLYVGGTAFGAMMGRVGIGMLTEFVSWSLALGILGITCFLTSIGFWWLLPQSRHFIRERGMSLCDHLYRWAGHLRNRSLLALYCVAFLLPSVFTTLFNYTTFHLSGPVYSFSPFESSLLFLVFGFGVVSSTLAGVLSDKYGRVFLIRLSFACLLLGSITTIWQPITVLVMGICLVTVGFFVGHSVASGAVGRVALNGKGHATSLYLMFYYLGNSVTGTLGGWFWHLGAWSAVVILTTGIALLGFIFSVFMKEQR